MSDETNQPPQLPDTSTWVRRAPGDVIEAGTPWVYVAKDGNSFAVNLHNDGEIHAVGSGTYWTPPPVEPAPWESISTDQDRPTLARVTYKPGERIYESVGAFYVDEGALYLADGVDSDYIVAAKWITHVELLHTYSPETHVLVERALIDEAVQIGDAFDPEPAWAFRFAEKVAALADGAES